MSELRQIDGEQEPIGIVISRGSRDEPPPRFSAYVWGQQSDATPAPAPKAA
jgi:hypothetical protein